MKKITLSLLILLVGVFSSNLKAQADIDWFITVWNTAENTLRPNSDNSIAFPAIGSNYTIYWEKVSDPSIHGTVTASSTGANAPYIIQLPPNSGGSYLIKSYGMTGFETARSGISENTTDPKRLQEIRQWGTTPWTHLKQAFQNCWSVILTAEDVPNLKNVTDLSGMFQGCSDLRDNADRINTWDVSNITNMQSMFNSCINFDEQLNEWNVSNVTNMSGMFQNCTLFDKPLNNWTTSNVTDMGNMFAQATWFNQDLSSWDVGAVTSMQNMFIEAKHYNNGGVSLNAWNVSQVGDMQKMFSATAFNQPINGWNVSNVYTMQNMFYANQVFNQPLDNWDVSNVRTMYYMFGYAKAFNQNLGMWKPRKVFHLDGIFKYSGMDCVNYSNTLKGWADDPTLLLASNTNSGSIVPNINSNNMVYNSIGQTARQVIESRGWRFYYDTYDASCGMSYIPTADDFITIWKTDNPSDRVGNSDKTIYYPFRAFYNGPAPLNPDGSYMTKYTIYWESVDNPDVFGTVKIDIGDPSSGMSVYGTSNSNAIIEFPKPGVYRVIAKVNNQLQGLHRFNGNSNTVFKYDQLKILDVEQWGTIKWAMLHNGFTYCKNLDITATDKPDLSILEEGDLSSIFSFCTKLENNNGSIGTWNVSTVKSFSYAFNHCYLFNQPLNAWDVSNVESMLGMFNNARTFNQPLDSWQTGKVVNMSFLFNKAFEFNQPLNTWDVHSVKNFEATFQFAKKFDQPLDNWQTTSATNMRGMFNYTDVFNQNINNWETSNVTDISLMFAHTKAFNQPLNDWSTGNVTEMQSTFAQAEKFNQPLKSWNVKKVYNMVAMFEDATAFNQNLGNWTLKGFINETNAAERMLDRCGMDCSNYSKTLIGWAEKSSELQPVIILGASGRVYATGAHESREILTNLAGTSVDYGNGETSNGWLIKGDTYDENCEILPIILANFDVVLNEDQSVKLSWTSLAEVNNDYYSIYKSDDIKEWHLLEEVLGAGNTSEQQTYQITDIHPYKQVTYYKLTQTDYDGTIVELGLGSVRMPNNDKNKVWEVFPNPTENEVIIKGKYSDINSIYLLNNLGIRIAVTVNITSPTTLSLDMGKMLSGVYFIHIDNNVFKVIKK